MPPFITENSESRIATIAAPDKPTSVLEHIQPQRISGRVRYRRAQLVLFRARRDQLAGVGAMPWQQGRQRPRRALGAGDELLAKRDQRPLGESKHGVGPLR